MNALATMTVNILVSILLEIILVCVMMVTVWMQIIETVQVRCHVMTVLHDHSIVGHFNERVL